MGVCIAENPYALSAFGVKPGPISQGPDQEISSVMGTKRIPSLFLLFAVASV